MKFSPDQPTIQGQLPRKEPQFRRAHMSLATAGAFGRFILMANGLAPLACLARNLPAVEETFVLREITALRRLGLRIKAFSLRQPDASVHPPEAPGLDSEVEILVQPRNPLFWLAHLFFALRFPRRYFHCLYAYVLIADGTWQSRHRSLSYFIVAPFAAWRLGRSGIKHLHAHFANAATSVALMAATLAGISFSFTAHAFDIFIDKLLLPAKLSAAAFVACISQYNVRYLREHYPEAEKAHLVVVRNGLDTTRFVPIPTRWGNPPASSPWDVWLKPRGSIPWFRRVAGYATRT